MPVRGGELVSRRRRVRQRGRADVSFALDCRGLSRGMARHGRARERGSWGGGGRGDRARGPGAKGVPAARARTRETAARGMRA